MTYSRPFQSLLPYLELGGSQFVLWFGAEHTNSSLQHTKQATVAVQSFSMSLRVVSMSFTTASLSRLSGSNQSEILMNY